VSSKILEFFDFEKNQNFASQDFKIIFGQREAGNDEFFFEKSHMFFGTRPP
jgi:hypothetical protein